MQSLHITSEQAAILDSGDDSRSDPVARALRTRIQALADASGRTCEVYHPDGHVWDARSPLQSLSHWAHVSGRAVTDDETQGYELLAYYPGGVYAGPDQHGIYPVLS